MSKVLNTRFLAAVVLCSLILPAAWAEELHVPATYFTIQSAIDAAQPGDEVIIAPGTYTGLGNREIDFLGKAITVRSTDPDDPAVVAGTVIDCEHSGIGFWFAHGEGPESVLAGLTITSGRGDAGGAVSCYECSPTFINCVFSQNSAGQGGALFCDYASPTLIGCAITGNSCYSFREADGGGIMCNYYCDLVLVACQVSNNRVDAQWAHGGGLYVFAGGSLTLTNCTIAGNVANGSGGAVGSAIDATTETPLLLTSCTIARNSRVGPVGGGTVMGAGQMVGCIFWGNTHHDARRDLLVTFSDWQGGHSGQGNIDADPLFVDPENGDYHLSAGSPCIDAGDPSCVPQPGETDLDGQYRLWDGDGNGVAIVDMGADEFGSYVFGDLNCDGAVDNFDLSAVVLALTNPQAYAATYPHCSAILADINHDGAIDNFDIGPFIALITGR
ncbi:MAG: right-handed parallel beta-helix repeat-containing protein [Phycisphaerae bacterium]|jgi:predicted outer membrane repeat protein